MIDILKDKIINNYKHALVDHYYDYLNVIEELNSQLPVFANEFKMSNRIGDINIEQNMEINYPYFCRKFLSFLRDELDREDEFTQTTVNNIFLDMIEERILEFSNNEDFNSEFEN